MRLFFQATALIAILCLSSCATQKGKSTRDRQVETIIKTARSFTGTPYKWGGTTRSGMDCSGLLCTSFSSVNYTLPRTSDAQSEVGQKVKIGNLQPGDLVFFATGKRRRKITHVGMVTEVRRGEVRFIHSSSSMGVIESSLSSEYYAKRFIMGRRPF
jgi:cell wall-associated NlpC family hydrolase